MNVNANNEHEGPAGGKAKAKAKAANANAAAAAAPVNYNMKPARKLNTRKNKHIINASGNPVLKGKKSKGVTMKKVGWQTNALKAQKKAAAAKKNPTLAYPKELLPPVTSEVILERIERYRKEATDIYNQGDKTSLERSKELVRALERTYYRMASVKMEEVVEVEIDANTITEKLLEAIENILQELENRVRAKIASNAEVAEFANLFGGLLKL